MLDLNTYQCMAAKTDMGNSIPLEDAIKCFALGLSGEVGELNDSLKKFYYHGKPLDPSHIKKELGDILWYLAMMAKCQGFTLEEVALANLEKLSKRYPSGFVPYDQRKDRGV